MLSQNNTNQTLLAAQMLREANLQADEALDFIATNFSGESTTLGMLAELGEMLEDAREFVQLNVHPVFNCCLDDETVPETEKILVVALRESLNCKIEAANFLHANLHCDAAIAQYGPFAQIAAADAFNTISSINTRRKARDLTDLAVHTNPTATIEALESLVSTVIKPTEPQTQPIITDDDDDDFDDWDDDDDYYYDDDDDDWYDDDDD